jgi:hypothetical protein
VIAVSLWKTWRANGARIVATGARFCGRPRTDTASELRGSQKQMRAICAPSFPQALAERKCRESQTLVALQRSARQKQAAPFYCYWIFK